jgi:ParB family transcriptional regulator, chromosome partitioning protein
MLTAALAADEDGAATSWRPGWMQVPPSRHVEGAASPPADAWDRIAGLFEADAVHESGAGPSSSEANAA